MNEGLYWREGRERHRVHLFPSSTSSVHISQIIRTAAFFPPLSVRCSFSQVIFCDSTETCLTTVLTHTRCCRWWEQLRYVQQDISGKSEAGFLVSCRMSVNIRWGLESQVQIGSDYDRLYHPVVLIHRVVPWTSWTYLRLQTDPKRTWKFSTKAALWLQSADGGILVALILAAAVLNLFKIFSTCISSDREAKIKRCFRLCHQCRLR